MPSNLRPARLMSAAFVEALATGKRFNPKITNHPALPVIDWSLIGAKPPVLPDTPADGLPSADIIVITWADAEWAAMQHVFCSGSEAMPYSGRTKGIYPGWQKYDKDIPKASDPEWTYWGYYRLVLVGAKRVLLFKSNTHLDYPGESYLSQLTGILIKEVKAALILSIGTAGGTLPADHLGTVNIVHAGALYSSAETPSQWMVYSNSWLADCSITKEQGFKKLLFPIPTTDADITGLVSQFNTFYETNYSMEQLNINGLSMGDNTPALTDMTPAGAALLTANSFVVGTSDGKLEGFACVEMDDAIIGRACQGKKTQFGFIRNISDPVQNAALPAEVQGNWGSAIYDAYGFYTSYNGALAAWAIITQ